MRNWEHPKNDGWQDVVYDFGLDEEGTKRVNFILNEACHVFYYHKDGNWQSVYKEEYASELATLFQQYPQLSSRVIRSKDRVVKMVAYRALDMMKE